MAVLTRCQPVSEFYTNPLTQLVVAPPVPPSAFGLAAMDWLEATDAANEDRWGRLPIDADYGKPPQQEGQMTDTAIAERTALTPANVSRAIEDAQAQTKEPAPPTPSERAQIKALLHDEVALTGVGISTRTGIADWRVEQLLDALSAEGSIERVTGRGPHRYALTVRRRFPSAPPEVVAEAAEQTISILRDRYLAYLRRENQARLLDLVEEGRIPATEDVLEALEAAAFS